MSAPQLHKRLVGFGHTIFEHDVRWGALLDNLHIRHAEKRRERAPVPPPSGMPGKLNGSPVGLRYAWPDPGVLV